MKFIFRLLWNNRLYSLIKISGLTIGLACMLLAILWVRDENSYDRFHEKGDRIFRITTRFNNLKEGQYQILGATSQVQGPAFKAKTPEVEEFVRIYPGLSTNFIGNQKPLLVKYIYADDAFFRVFSFPLLYGNPGSALTRINSVVLTEKTALRFFGKTNVVGETIKLEEGHGTETFVISGIAKTVPTHSSIQFEAVLPFAYLQTMFPDDGWLNSYLSTFVLLHPKANVSGVKNKFAEIFREEAAGQLSNEHLEASQYQYGLQPIAGVHLNDFEKGPVAIIGSGSLADQSVATYSYIIMGIAGFILMMACVNFLNLSIAGSLKRSKEMGIRKISGGTRIQIIWQFLIEASILCGISYILAFLVVVGALPVFNHLAEKQISFSLPADTILFLYGAFLMGLCVLLVGLYPAIKLSLFNVIEVLYNKQKLNGRNYFARGLIVLQFTLAVSLVIASIIYYEQMNFIARKDLGYDYSDMIKIHLPNYRNLNPQMIGTLKNALIMAPSIVQITNGDMIPVSGAMVMTLNGAKTSVVQSNIDQDFLSVFRIPLKQGRNFSNGFPADLSQSVIVNESFASILGMKNSIGQQITMTDGQGNHYPRTIVGVAKDYHYESLREKINPLVLLPGQSEYIWIKIQKGKAMQAASAIGTAFGKIFPEYDYRYTFMDDEISGQYAGEQRWKLIISYASVLAILICSLGLFGLAHLTTMRRTKEIGIRKVLGASALNISALLSVDFLKLVALAIIIAAPLTWYFMNHWLENFSYRIQISILQFVLAAIIVLLIALITVSSQTFKAAISNPVNSLRTE